MLHRFYYTFFLLLLLLSRQYIFAEQSYRPIICKASTQGKLAFSKTQVQSIVTNTGLDSRSICDFIFLASHTYKNSDIRQFILSDHSQLKLFFLKHRSYKQNSHFFQEIAAFLFDQKYQDYDQVIYSLVLSDLLYGYNIGETIPLFMNIFLYYSSENKNTTIETQTAQKIINYLINIKLNLLQNKDFNSDNINKYTKKIAKELKSRISQPTHNNNPYSTSRVVS